MNTAILPLAITMMAGPQIMSAIIFVASERAVKTSLAFVFGVLVAMAIGVAALRGILSLVGDGASLGDSSDNGSTGQIIQFALVGLLIAAAIRNYVGRETVDPPKWLGKLQQADPKQAFRTGLLVILVMPSDLIVMLTVATNLEQSGDSLAAAVPFILATALVAALPLLGYLILHRRAVGAMPKLRDWMKRQQLAGEHHRLRRLHHLNRLRPPGGLAAGPIDASPEGRREKAGCAGPLHGLGA